MTSRDPFPKDSNELSKSERRLYDTLVAPFERPFESLGYQAVFEFTPATNQPVFRKNGVWEPLRETTGLSPAMRQPWSIKLGYDPKKERITPTLVEVPVQSTAEGETLVLQRVQGGVYLVMHRPEHGAPLAVFETEADILERQVFEKNNAQIIDEGYVNFVTANAGYLSPEIFTSPNDLQEHVAETLSTSTQWARKETIVIPIDEVTQVTLERSESVLPDDSSRAEDDDYVRQSDGTITATLQWTNPSDKGQLVVSFDYADHFVYAPKVRKQRLVRAFDDAVIANYGPEAHQIVGAQTIELNATSMDTLAEELALLTLD